jgi:glutamate-1-semialdehyde 2,1-aminomutase
VVGTLVGMYFGEGHPPTNFEQAKTTDERMYAAFFHAMLAEGVALAPGAYEALFVGVGHTDDVIEAIGQAADRAAVAAVRAVGA